MTTRRGRLGGAAAAVVGLLLVASGCSTTYYRTMEAFGIHKRDLLVDRVEDARDAQEDAKEQFESALDEFSAVTGFSGGELEATYERLDGEYERSAARAEEVRDRIDAVEDVAEALFVEWERELDEYTSAKLRRASEEQLRQTRRRYEQLIGAMRRAERTMDPVLSAFKDQVLFLKHNLNAQAIRSLQEDLATVEADIRRLVREMEAAIAEADAFIREMAPEAAGDGR